jgi:hypothetical protein
MENEEKTETPEEPLPEYKGKNLDEAISHAAEDPALGAQL